MTYLVGEIPHGDTDTARNVLAHLHDTLVVLLLLREVRRARRRRHADVQLCDRDLEAQRGELLHDGLKRRGDLADDEVALEPYTVERDAVREELLREVEHRRRLRARVLDVVLVDVQFRVGIRGARRLKGDWDELRAEGVVEDVRTPCAVVVEGL